MSQTGRQRAVEELPEVQRVVRRKEAPVEIDDPGLEVPPVRPVFASR